MADARSLYDEDFNAWTEQQAGALRAAARAGGNLALRFLPAPSKARR